MSIDPRPRPPGRGAVPARPMQRHEPPARTEGPRRPVPGPMRMVPHPIPESVRHRLANFRRTIEEVSAGGIVVDVTTPEPRVAVIARLNRAGRLEWCLPKGHVENGETAEQAALREVAEETGISGRVVGTLGSIDYWFSVEGRRVHKTVHHYLIEATGGELSVEGDPDAEAVDVAWVRLADLDTRLSFVNERRIARVAGERLADPA